MTNGSEAIGGAGVHTIGGIFFRGGMTAIAAATVLLAGWPAQQGGAQQRQAAPPAGLQITGVPGSPSATTTIQCDQIPPPQKFGGKIETNATQSNADAWRGCG